jgi:predicted RNase H-like nuclease (RuvC/YqgF family)
MIEQNTAVQQDTDTSAPDAGEHETEARQQESPHHEARKYRKRAQAAESALGELQRELEEKATRLDELEQTVAHLERRASVDALLLEAEAIDIESARLLTEMAVAHMDEPDVETAVTELKRRKPFLFKAASAASTLAAKVDGAARVLDAAANAAVEAQLTGSRTDLLRYLRLRRKKR